MDVKAVLTIFLILLTTACVDDSTTSGEGFVTETLSISDTELRPDQETIVELEVVNYNTGDSQLKSEDIEIFNSGQLEVKEKSCTPSEIGSAREGLSPKMRCTWNLKAPGEEFVKGFDSKPLSFNLRYNFSNSLESEEPLTVEVNSDPAESTETVTKEFSNNDISVKLETVSPVPSDGSRSFDIEIEKTGSGNLKSDYSLDYSPENLFENCPTKSEPINGKTNLACRIESDTEGSRKAFISTSYKYERILSKSIEVVNN
jgi:hypothetical protein